MLNHCVNYFSKKMRFNSFYNKCHAAGWADVYLFILDDEQAGYGSVWGKDKGRTGIPYLNFLKEPLRKYAGQFFSSFIKVSAAGSAECQTNDVLLTQMLLKIPEI
jgi:hypothetical protein